MFDQRYISHTTHYVYFYSTTNEIPDLLTYYLFNLRTLLHLRPLFFLNFVAFCMLPLL